MITTPACSLHTVKVCGGVASRDFTEKLLSFVLAWFCVLWGFSVATTVVYFKQQKKDI